MAHLLSDRGPAPDPPLDPRLFEDSTGMRDPGPEIAETHSAIVFLVGDKAYKVKKAVNLGFLDFRSREAREAVCHREVELNRRLAPDVYLGVADVHGPDGSACDHLVVMRRMPGTRRLSALLAAGTPVEGHLWDLAHLVAAFHSRSPRSVEADEAASAASTMARWDANSDELQRAAGSLLGKESVERTRELARRYVAGRGRLFEQRVLDGRAVDGHGDLLADDIFFLDDGPRVLDCIEFDDRLRLGDGLADAAFLAMDLERLGRADLGRVFLDAYAEHLDDVWPASLAHHHIAYRAQVRAKVSAIRAGQGAPDAAAQARQLLKLCTSHLEAARVRLILVGGLPGTGKSFLADGLSGALGATMLRSDEVRKEIHGLPVHTPSPAPFGQGVYSEDGTAATYGALLDRATVALAMGETVVLDASWTSAHWRQQARSTASAAQADLVELRCATAPMIAAGRILRRSMGSPQASDATPAIAVAMGDLAAPWPEATTIDTTRDPAHSLATALQQVDGRVDPVN